MIEEKGKNKSEHHDIPDNKVVRWCAIGDSFTYLNDHLNETGSRLTRGYVSRVCDEIPYLKVKNMGINGSTTQNWLTVRMRKADIYTLLLGTNDWKQEIPVGNRSDYEQNVTGTILGNLSVIISHIRQVSPEAIIIVFNPVERSDFVYINDYHNTAPGSYQTIRSQSLAYVAHQIFTCVQGKKILTIDLHGLCGFTQENVIKFKRVRAENGCVDLPYPDFIGIPYNPDKDDYPYPVEAIALTYDGLHPSDEGSQIIANIFAEAITQALKNVIRFSENNEG
jgi:lysophospholipase L1-like esterase